MTSQSSTFKNLFADLLKTQTSKTLASLGCFILYFHSVYSNLKLQITINCSSAGRVFWAVSISQSLPIQIKFTSRDSRSMEKNSYEIVFSKIFHFLPPPLLGGHHPLSPTGVQLLLQSGEEGKQSRSTEEKESYQLLLRICRKML